MIRVGVAGWSVSRFLTHRFPADGTHLERYARTFSCVEINSSFYRHHTSSTYAKWAAATPPRFMFAAKLSQVITPRMYWSRYEMSYIERLAGLLRNRADAGEVWCIFDNTGIGAAIENAWELQNELSEAVTLGSQRV